MAPKGANTWSEHWAAPVDRETSPDDDYYEGGFGG